MKRSFKYRIYPTKKQLRTLETTLEECRWLYNDTLAFRKDAWEQEKRSVSRYDTQARIPLLKNKRPSLMSVHSQVLQNVNKRVDCAFQTFFRRCKTGEKLGYPRFKGKNRYDSFTYTQLGFSVINGGRLHLSKIGNVKLVYHRPIRGKIKTLTLRRSPTSKWYASFSVECEQEILLDNYPPVGIDVGLKTFAVLSDKTEVTNPRFFRKEEKALARVQRKHSKFTKGSPERRKHRKAVARVHERITSKRANFAHQESRKIINKYGTIFVEDLHVNRMVHNRYLSKGIHDAAWSDFFSKLFYKAEDAGRTCIAVGPAFTSQDCSKCHHRQGMPLDARMYSCAKCGLSIDRDLNASLNILALGLQSIGNQSVEAPVPTRRGVITNISGRKSTSLIATGVLKDRACWQRWSLYVADSEPH